jgi:hypothetical protein
MLDNSPVDLHAEIARLRALVQSMEQTLQQWQQPDHIRLHAGELSRQEMRAVLAVVKAIARTLATARGRAGL